MCIAAVVLFPCLVIPFILGSQTETIDMFPCDSFRARITQWFMSSPSPTSPARTMRIHEVCVGESVMISECTNKLQVNWIGWRAYAVFRWAHNSSGRKKYLLLLVNAIIGFWLVSAKTYNTVIIINRYEKNRRKTLKQIAAAFLFSCTPMCALGRSASYEAMAKFMMTCCCLILPKVKLHEQRSEINSTYSRFASAHTEKPHSV